ncbi:recombination protein RecR [bacterium]|nr:MAG: recombination protein RecR [bacterium]
MTESVKKLIESLEALPSIGKKTARRIVFYLLKKRELAEKIADGIKEVMEKVRFCSVCGGITEEDPCRICRDEKREKKICVVEDPMDIPVIEQTGVYHGYYHVLGGVISPVDGIGPEDLRIDELMQRLEGMEEVIIATNPTTEGEATAIYLTHRLKEKGIKVTRIARGLPPGSSIDLADSITLSRALEGRKEL